MVRMKQTARKNTGGAANIGRKAQKTRLKRAMGVDAWWGTAKKTFVEPKAGRLRTDPNNPIIWTTDVTII